MASNQQFRNFSQQPSKRLNKTGGMNYQMDNNPIQIQSFRPDDSQSREQKQVQQVSDNDASVQHSFKDTHRDFHSSMAIQVKTVGRKGIRYTKRITHPHGFHEYQNQVRASADYDGTTSSPHIKAQYIDARQRSPANIMRARSTKPNIEGFPLIQGQALKQPQRLAQTKPHGQKNSLTSIQKRQDLEGRLSRHTPSTSHAQQVAEEMNKDILSVARIKPKSQHNTKKPHIGVTNMAKPYDIISSVERARPHHIELSMIRKDFHGETSSSGINNVHTVNTMYDPSPNIKQIKHMNHSSRSSTNAAQQKLRAESRLSAGVNSMVEKPQGSHVQLTEFLASKKHEQELRIKNVMEHQIDESEVSMPGTRDFMFSNASYDAATGKVTDYHNTSPAVLVPKLDTKIISYRGGESSKNDKTDSQQDETKNDHQVFAQMVNTTKSEISMPSDPETQHFETQDQDPEKEKAFKKRPPQTANETSPRFTLSQPQIRGTQRNNQLQYLMQQQKGVLISGGQDVNSTQMSNYFHMTSHQRTQSVMSNNLVAQKKTILINDAMSKFGGVTPLPSQPTLDGESFRLVAQRKQVVPNMKKQVQNWERKRNAMSKNEIKRQSTLLQNLPMISMGHKNYNMNDTNTSNAGSPTYNHETAYPSRIVDHTNIISAQDSVMDTGQSLLQSPLNFPPSVAVQDGTYRAGHNPDLDQIQVLHQQRETEGVSTAEGVSRDIFDSRFRSKGSESPTLTQNNTALNLAQVSNWGNQNIQIGSKHLDGQGMNSQEFLRGQNHHNIPFDRRLNTSHDIHIKGSPPASNNHYNHSFSIIPNNYRTASQQAIDSIDNINLISAGYKTTHFQQWGEGKPTTTSTHFQKQATANQLTKFFEKKKNTSTPGHNRSMTVSHAKRYKSNQRQMKGLQNLGDIRSQRIDGIKISRLNNLGAKEDGNPLDKFNKLQQMQEKRSSLLYVGGVQTQVLSQFHAEAKFQVEAIQDFATKESLYNQVAVPMPQENKSIIPLKKLIGRQAILMPDKLTRGDYNIQQNRGNVPLDPQLSRNLQNQYSMHASHESMEHKMSASMMRQLLNGSQMSQTSQPGQAVVVTSGQEIQKEDTQDQASEPREDTGTNTILDDNMTPKNLDDSVLLSQRNSQLSPQCNSIKLQHKEDQSKLKNQMLEQIAYRSRTRSIRNGSRTHNLSEASKVRESQNKDMADMLKNYNKKQDTTINSDDNTQQIISQNRKSEATVSSNKKRKVKKGGARSGMSINANSQNRLETSDDNNSNSALNPVGIHEQHNDQMETQKSQIIKNEANLAEQKGNAYLKMQVKTEDQSNKKQQVFSHYDDTPGVQKKSGSKSSSPTNQMRQSGTDERAPVQSLLQTAEERDNHTLPGNLGSLVAQSSEDKQELAQNFGNVGIIGVTQVKIQKAQSVLYTEDKRPRVNIQAQKTAHIKHVDQLQDPESSNAAIIDQNQGLTSQTSGQQHDRSGGAINRSYQEILNWKNVHQNSGEVTIPLNYINSNEKTTLQNISTQRDNSTLKDPLSQQFMSQEVIKSKHGVQTSRRLKPGGLVNDYPNMLNLISQKASQQEAFKNASGEKSLNAKVSSTNQTEMMDQLNVINSMVPNQQSAYHQLEPKLFPANSKALKKAALRNRSQFPSQDNSIDVGGATTSRKPSIGGNHMVSRKVSVHIDSKGEINAESSQMYPQNHKSPPKFEEDEMAYVSHKAIESRIIGSHKSKQAMELKKRQFAKKASHMTSIDKTGHGVSVLSSHVAKNSGSPLRQHSRYNSVPDGSIFGTTKRVRSQSGPDSVQSQNDEDDNQQSFGVRKILTSEKDMVRSINIEKLLQSPVDQVYATVQSLIGQQGESGVHSPVSENSIQSIDSVLSDDRKKSQKKRKIGLSRLNSLQLSEVYKDSLKYEFKENELYKLLGEQIVPVSKNKAKRRYFLKMTSMQLTNIDCQSGLICNGAPLTLPISKMANLFFLSQDQLQQVLGQSLCLKRVGNLLKLNINQDILREITYKTTPRSIRDDYFSQPLQVNVVEDVEGHKIVKESFNVQIKMPCFEIVTSAQEDGEVIDKSSELFKTTMTHYVTGLEMVKLLKRHNLLDWVKFAQDLIKKRTFGVGQEQMYKDTSQNRLHFVNSKDELILYQDPIRLAQEQAIANNLQLTFLMQKNFILQVEFMQPLYLKLQAENEYGYKRQDHEHLAGYLPDSYYNASKYLTVARMQIPYSKLAFIRQTFGDKIISGEGCFLDCLYNTVALQIDPKKNIIRLKIPSWRHLEDLQIKTLSKRFYAEQQYASHALQENLKYLCKTNTGNVKQLFKGAKNQTQTFNQGNLSQNQTRGFQPFQQRNTRQSESNHMQTKRKSIANQDQGMNQEDVAVNEQKIERLRVNNTIECQLKISSLVKTVISMQFAPQSEKSIKLVRTDQPLKFVKLSLNEFFNQQQE